MKKYVPLLVLGALALVGGAAAAQDSTPAKQAAAAAAPANPPAPTKADAPAILQRACQACHDLGVITNGSHTAEEWPAILQRMKANGANVSDDELKALQQYLVENYSATA